MFSLESDNFEKFLEKLNDIDMIKELNKFMGSSASKFKTSIKKRTIQANYQPTNYSESWMHSWDTFNKERYYKSKKRNGLRSWYILKNRAPHEHLVTQGHKLYSHGQLVGYVPARDFVADGVNDYIPKCKENFEKKIGSLIDGTYKNKKSKRSKK